MDESAQFANNLNLETGHLCLDFANTVEWHASDHPEESLLTYGDLVSWAQGVGVLDEPAAHLLETIADHSGAEAAAVMQQAIELREAIYRIFSATARQAAPLAADLAVLNRALPEASAHQFIAYSGDGFSWAWRSSGDEDLAQMLWPVVRSAAELLTSDQLDRVSVCADDRGCGYLFYDTSRNRSRKWCSMDGCGNRAKARRHYHRHTGDDD